MGAQGKKKSPTINLHLFRPEQNQKDARDTNHSTKPDMTKLLYLNLRGGVVGDGEIQAGFVTWHLELSILDSGILNGSHMTSFWNHSPKTTREF